MVSVGIVPVSQFPHQSAHKYSYAFSSGEYPFNIVGSKQGPCSFCPNEGPIVETTAMGKHAFYGWEKNIRSVAYCSGCAEKYVISNPKSVMFEFLVREFPILPKDIWDMIMSKV